MAIVTLKSTQITNRDASPEVLNTSNVDGGRVREAVGVVAMGTVDSSGSTYRFVSIPSNAKVSEIKFWADAALGADTALTLDLFDTTVNGGAVVKAGFFSADVDLNAAVAAGLDATHTASGAGTHLVSKADKMVWECLSGISADPNKWYDVVASSTVNNSTTGANVALKIKYIV